jgi:diguanylate cyclase (GGDEF)-like protein/PAS domain S-box-containing protein
MHGYKEGELVGKHIWDFFETEEERENLRQYLKKLLKEQPPPTPWFSKDKTKDGRFIDVQVDWNYKRDKDGIIKGFVSVITDITQRKQIEKELNKLLITDKLTQAYNRTKFEEIMPIEMERTRRFNHPLSLLIFDIDHFKKINDTFGHLFGDYVLKTIADIVREHMRKVNYFIRWGGEEFIIIAIETNFEKAKILSERIRKEVDGYDFDKIDKITISFGVTQFKEDDTLDTFVKRADDALYQAKEKGRNRVEGIV